jgi:4-hydroxybenzoate polyprenyltransferase
MTQTLPSSAPFLAVLQLPTAATRIGRTVGQLLLESRPAVQAIFIVRACIAAGFPFRPSVHAAGLITGWSMLSVAIYLLNGVTDRLGDRVNGSGRPIATGALLPRTALSATVLLTVTGTMICAAEDVRSLPLAAAFLALGCAYSTGPALKNSPVGFAIAIGGGAVLTYAIGWLAGGALRPAQLSFGLAMAAWVSVACAAKDFSDTEGDRVAGRRTWPVLLGRRRAAARLRSYAIVGSLLMVAVALFVAGSVWPAALVLVTGSVALGNCCAGSANSTTTSSRAVRRRPYRIFMSTQYCANVALALSHP